MTKNNRLEIRISTADKALARQLSQEILGDINLSKLFIKMLHTIHTTKPIIIDEQLIDFRLAVRQLSGIARNLNQVTRRLNSDDNISLEPLGNNYLTTLTQYVCQLNDEFKLLINNNK